MNHQSTNDPALPISALLVPASAASRSNLAWKSGWSRESSLGKREVTILYFHFCPTNYWVVSTHLRQKFSKNPGRCWCMLQILSRFTQLRSSIDSLAVVTPVDFSYFGDTTHPRLRFHDGFRWMQNDTFPRWLFFECRSWPPPTRLSRGRDLYPIRIPVKGPTNLCNQRVTPYCHINPQA